LENDKAAAIDEGVKKLITEITRKNKIAEDDIISIQFSVTWDLVSNNPAASLRKIGYSEVPLFCVQEPAYAGSMPKVIRVLLTWNTESREKTVSVYLEGASSLRPRIS